MYKLRVTSSYKNTFDKLIRVDEALKKRIMATLLKLVENPKHPSLHSHKVNTLAYG